MHLKCEHTFTHTHRYNGVSTFLQQLVENIQVLELQGGEQRGGSLLVLLVDHVCGMLSFQQLLNDFDLQKQLVFTVSAFQVAWLVSCRYRRHV